MRAFILTVVIWLLALPAFASESESVDTGKVVASIVSSHDSVAPGHNYGFEGTPLFPVKFTVSPDAEIGTDITVVSNFYYLVCEEICIPEYGSASLSVAVGDPIIDARWSPEIEAALAVSPIRGEVQGAIQKSGGIVDISFMDLPEGDYSNAYFFPFDQGVLGHSNPQSVTRGADGLRLTTTPEYLWEEATPNTLEGILTYESGGSLKGTNVSLAVGQSLDIGAAVVPKAAIGGVTLWTALSSCSRVSCSL